MKLTIDVDDQATPALRELAQTRLASARRQFIERAGREVLTQIIEDHPVDTGRASAAWNNALQQLGGTAPSQGSHAAAIAEGRRQGSGALTHGTDDTALHATNSVKYIGYLEYGTRQMAPFRMVRRALVHLRSRLPALFRLTEASSG